MKHLLIAACTIYMLIINSGCDPRYDIDYKVYNQAEESIKIVVDHPGYSTDTNVITPGTKLIFFNEFGHGRVTTDYMDRLEVLPVELSIFNESGIPYNKSEEDMSLREKFYPRKKSLSEGMFQLTVQDEDFE